MTDVGNPDALVVKAMQSTPGRDDGVLRQDYSMIVVHDLRAAGDRERAERLHDAAPGGPDCVWHQHGRHKSLRDGQTIEGIGSLSNPYEVPPKGANCEAMCKRF